jgi:hypothetical protein
MPKDPAALGFNAKRINDREVPVLISIVIAVAPTLAWVFFRPSDWWVLIPPIFVLILLLAWVKGNAVNRTQEEFKRELPSWQGKRHYAALHIRGHYRPGMEPQFNDQNRFKRSEDIQFMLNRMEEVCEHDSKNLFGHAFFRENFWPILKFYWIYTNDLIIDEQKLDPARWPYLFKTFKKYETIFNDRVLEERRFQMPPGMCMQGELLSRELNATDPDGGVRW